MDFPLGNSELQEAVKTSTVGTSVHYIQSLVGCTWAHLPAYAHGPGPDSGSRAVMSLNSAVQCLLPSPPSSLSLPSPEPISLAGIESGLGMLPVW